MGLWNLYFAAKLYLFTTGRLQPVWWMNLLFALALLVPFRNRWLRIARRVLAIVVGVVLLYHEANLPTIGRALEQLAALSSLAPRDLFDLLGRLLPISTVYAIVAVLIAYFVIDRWVRISTFVLLALIATTIGSAI